MSKAIQVSVHKLHGNVLGLMAGFAIERAICGMFGLGLGCVKTLAEILQTQD